MNNALTSSQQQMVLDNLGLAHSLVAKMLPKVNGRLSKGDLLGSAYLALCKAALNYDPSRGTKFSTPAWKYMWKETLQFIYKDLDNRPDRKAQREKGTFFAEDIEEPEPKEFIPSSRLHTIWDTWDERTQEVMRLHCLNYNHREIGEIVGMTRERVRQIYETTIIGTSFSQYKKHQRIYGTQRT